MLLTAAEAGLGMSIGSRDLATRLKPLIDTAAMTQRRRRLVFPRQESRALQRITQTQIEPSDELQNLVRRSSSPSPPLSVWRTARRPRIAEAAERAALR